MDSIFKKYPSPGKTPANTDVLTRMIFELREEIKQLKDHIHYLENIEPYIESDSTEDFDEATESVDPIDNLYKKNWY